MLRRYTHKVLGRPFVLVAAGYRARSITPSALLCTQSLRAITRRKSVKIERADGGASRASIVALAFKTRSRRIRECNCITPNCIWWLVNSRYTIVVPLSRVPLLSFTVFIFTRDNIITYDHAAFSMLISRRGAHFCYTATKKYIKVKRELRRSARRFCEISAAIESEGS